MKGKMIKPIELVSYLKYAKLHNVPRSTVYSWVEQRKIMVFKVRGRHYIPAELPPLGGWRKKKGAL